MNILENDKINPCPNSADCKHMISNSWGSLRNNGYCGICNFCMGIFTPQRAILAYEQNHLLSEDLLKNLIVYSNAQIEGYWLCASCNIAFTDDESRTDHFREVHSL